jgi:UV DNA damage repair endonuclease
MNPSHRNLKKMSLKGRSRWVIEKIKYEGEKISKEKFQKQIWRMEKKAELN